MITSKFTKTLINDMISKKQGGSDDGEKAAGKNRTDESRNEKSG